MVSVSLSGMRLLWIYCHSERKPRSPRALTSAVSGQLRASGVSRALVDEADVEGL